MSRRNLLLLVIAVFLSIVCHDRNSQNPHARYVAEGYKTIDEWALERPADDELVAGAMRGMVDVLRRRGDEHSRYLRPQAAQLLREEISGDFGGVGVRIRLLGDPPQLTVVGPPEPGTPAFYGGIQPDDRIVAIDGEPTQGLSMSGVLDQMRGGVGEPVTLSILRDGNDQPITITLTREIIHVPSVIGDRRLSDGSWRHLLEQDERIALVRINTFGDHTAEELQETLPQLIDEGMQALVLDLRENAGGALDAAVEVCEMFLPPGAPIVETRGRDAQLLERFISHGGPHRDLPMVVLVNGNSASASEIVAACLQDNQRAVVIGSRSFGKGTVQRLIPLESGESLLKITAATYWRPSGVDIHRRPDTPEDQPWGVSPDDGFEALLEEDAYADYLRARSERDLIAIDAPEPTYALESAEKEPAKIAPPVEATAAEKAADENPSEPSPPFVDAVLDRAVEYLQSQLDASAAITLPSGKASPNDAA